MVPLLIGLGVDEFSVSPSAVPIVKDVIRKIRYSEAERLAETILSSESAVDVLDRCRAMVERIAPEILELVG
jgi:phosphoenolpyruvate-protein kinase (PTS system EI component)